MKDRAASSYTRLHVARPWASPVNCQQSTFLQKLSRQRHGRQREVEDGPFVRFAFRPDLAAVPLENAGDGRKAYARAREVARAMQAMKRPEQFLRMRHVEAGAVVAHEERCHRAL